MKKIRLGITNGKIFGPVSTENERVARVWGVKTVLSEAGRSYHSVGLGNEITLLPAFKNGRLIVENFDSFLDEHLRCLAAQAEAITIGYTAAETLTSCHGMLNWNLWNSAYWLTT